MRVYRLYILLLSLLLSVQCFGQDQVPEDIDAYITELNAQSPILDGNDWALTSFAAVGDTVNVELQAPKNLSMFLSMLTSKNDNVRRLWYKQLSQFGDSWNHLVELVVANNRTLILTLRPEDTDVEGKVIFTPDKLQLFGETK